MAGLLPIVFSAIACTQSDPPPREFELRGQILALRPNNEVLLKHDDIKGFMPAMTMPYQVREAALLHGKTAGDLVTATLAAGETEAWLTRLDKTGHAAITEPVPEASPVASVSLLKPGDLAPQDTLTDERGNDITLTGLRGSAVAITFIYTRCPLPQFCPMLDRRFAEVQRLVARDPALKGRVQLVSVSFDPDSDTPAALRAHAGTLGADPAMWRFVTAPREVVDRFAAAFGVNVIRERDRTITHNLRSAVLDPQGRVVTIHDASGWTAEDMVNDLGRASAGTPPSR